MIHNTRVIFSSAQTIELNKEELKELQPGQLLVSNFYTLISPGTEQHQFKSLSAPLTYPYSPGYAGVGEVIAVGSNVEHFHVGDCVYHTGRHQKYAQLEVDKELITKVPGAYREMIHIPFTRMAQIAYTSLLFSYPVIGRVVAVVGLGLIGNLALQLFHLEKAQVYGMDLHPLRKHLAHQILQKDIDPHFTGKNDERFADIVIEASGANEAILTALKIAKKRGKVILLGSPRESLPLDLYHLIHRTGIALPGAHESLIPWFSNDLEPNNRNEITQQMMSRIMNQEIMVDSLISDIVSPDSLPQVYRDLSSPTWHGLTFLIEWKNYSS